MARAPAGRTASGWRPPRIVAVGGPPPGLEKHRGRPRQFGATLRWYASPRGDLLHTDGLIASEADWVLRRAAGPDARPFFVAVGFFRPHTPFVAPRAYFGLYPVDRVPVVSGVDEDLRDIPPAALASQKREEAALTDDLRRQCRQAYLAAISFLDAQVGRVLDSLDRLGLATNTVLVFNSDHGDHMGEHGLWQKRSLFEESARVPLIIVAPGVARPGGVAPAPVSQVDIFPTLAELCGVRAPNGLQGQSFVPMLRDPSAANRGWALTQVTRGRATRGGGDGRPQAVWMGYSLCTRRHRHTEWDEGREGRELYDHDLDPGELRNLADDPAHSNRVAELSAQLRAAVASTFPKSGRTPQIREGLWSPVLSAPGGDGTA